MKKIFVLMFVIGLTFQGYSQIDSKQIVGKWNYTVDLGGEVMTGVFNFFEKEGVLAGEVHTGDGSILPFTKVEKKEATKLYMEVKTEDDLIKITIDMNGDKFSGMGSSYQGEAPITGEKQKE